MGRLDGKVAIVTGGARGQGAAEARRFAEEGASVLVTDVLDEEGEKTVAAISADLPSTRGSDSVAYRHHDVTQEDEWEATAADAVERFGGLHVLVNNAGIASGGPLAMTPLDDYMNVINVNQVGVFLGMKVATPHMVSSVQRDGGTASIINISSVDGMVGMAMTVAYVASKFAVRGMTKTAALELGMFGIRVNSIHPGGVDTPLLDPAKELGVDLRQVFSNVPLNRIGTPSDVADLALFLASEESSYCTGSEFVIDGGLIAGFGFPFLQSGS
ncbi:MAG TPA: glucose 1-dehydrogenase [Acidimicrobiia bacterium]|nr:glucose 1-dehydrogenase [Acidimicrobiia bacterium]